MITHIPIAKSNDESYEGSLSNDIGQEEKDACPYWYIPLYSELSTDMQWFLETGNYVDDRDDLYSNASQ
jgi:hypothetical protein